MFCVAVADSPEQNDESRREMAFTFCQSPETSAAGGLQGGTLNSSLVSRRPFVTADSQPVQSTLCTSKLSGGLTAGALHMSAATFEEPISVIRPDTHSDIQPQSASLSSRSEKGARSTSGLDGSNYADSRNSSSPEIDVLPVVKRPRLTSDCDVASSDSVVSGKPLQQCSKSSVDGDGELRRADSERGRSSGYRCGSPGLDENGEFSHHIPKIVPAALTDARSSTVSGVKLLPLSQVISSGIFSADAISLKSVSVSCTAEVSAETVQKKRPNNPRLSRSSQQTEIVRDAPKAGRRRSSRLRVPKSVTDQAKRCPLDVANTVKHVSFDKREPTDKENVCSIQPAESTLQQHSGQKDSKGESPPPSKRTKMRVNSCDSTPSGDDSDASLARVRRSFIKYAQQDVEQKLPAAWDRRVNKSPVASRRSSDRIRRKESSAEPVRGSDCKLSSPVVERKRMASSSSSGLSSCEKKPAKKLARTVAMTSLHSEYVSRVISLY